METGVQVLWPCIVSILFITQYSYYNITIVYNYVLLKLLQYYFNISYME